MSDEQPRDWPAPAAVCRTCLGARSVLLFRLVKGRTREVWSTCPTCGGPPKTVKRPD